jgi:Protein of unknown function (DUF2924)
MKPGASGRRSIRTAFDLASRDLKTEIERIESLDIPALRERWTALFDTSPSPRLGRVFMIRAITYRMRERVFGGLKPSTQRILDRFSEARGRKTQPHAPRQRAGAGTVLIRQWKGVQHRVTVLDSEVLYRNRRYKSLSEVARTITGTHRSGPLFFGLKKRTKEAARGY